MSFSYVLTVSTPLSTTLKSQLKKNLSIKSFVEDEICLIIPKSHPFARKNKIDKEDLYSLNFITLNSTSTIQQFINYKLIQNEIELIQTTPT